MWRHNPPGSRVKSLRFLAVAAVEVPRVRGCRQGAETLFFCDFGANGGKRHYSVWVGRHDMAGRSFLDLIWSIDSYFGALKAPRASPKQYILRLGQNDMAFQRVSLDIGRGGGRGWGRIVSPPPKEATLG